MPPRKSLQERIEQARKVHGDKYDYSLWPEKITAKTRVVTICPDHGRFDQKLDNHVNNRTGCPSCGRVEASFKQRLSREFRIQQSRKVHGDKYDYSKLPVMIMSKTIVTITCRVHGDFEQAMNHHINTASGCPSCAGLRPLTRTQRIVQARKIHGAVYDYSLWGSKLRDKTQVQTICKDHGVWSHYLGSHVNGGHGCPSCAGYGFKPNDTGYLYILLSENYMKIGVAGDVERRVTTLCRNTPFSFDLFITYKFDIGRNAYNVEQALHKISESANLTGFDGATEWFTLSPQNIENLGIITMFSDEFKSYESL